MIRSYNSQDTDRVIRIWLEASILAHHFIPAMYWIEKQEDMRNIYLPERVYAKNEPSVAFYEKQGFRFVEKHVEEETGEQELVMKWNR